MVVGIPSMESWNVAQEVPRLTRDLGSDLKPLNVVGRPFVGFCAILACLVHQAVPSNRGNRDSSMQHMEHRIIKTRLGNPGDYACTPNLISFPALPGGSRLHIPACLHKKQTD